MSEQRGGSNIRGSLEEILSRLHISGRIREGKLMKKDLRNETNQYIAENNINHFAYADMPKALLKYNYCYYMPKNIADRAKHFNMNVENVEKISSHHAGQRSEMGPSDEAEQIQVVDVETQVAETDKANPKLKRLKLSPLPDHHIEEALKNLISKNFSNENLSKDEEIQKKKMIEFLEDELNEDNYFAYWTFFSKIEECTQQEELAKFNRSNAELFECRTEGLYKLNITGYSDYLGAIKEGVKVSIAPTKTPQKQKYAYVIQVTEKVIVLRMEGRQSLNLEKDSTYNVQFLLDRTCFQMEREALHYLQEHNLVKFMFPSKPGPTPLKNIVKFDWINESFHQNPEQQSAVTHIVEKTSHPAPYILMGPPGTGKTTTIVEAICQIIRKDPSAHILVVASSNYACNEIARRLFPFIPKDKLYRLFAGSKAREISSIDHKLIKISNLKFGYHYYPHLEDIKMYNVVICTPVVSGKFAQADIDYKHFTYVFIDDAGSCTEVAALIPIAGVISSPNKIHGQIVISGDPKQLGPVIKAEMAKNSLGISLLERLIDTGIYIKNPKTGKYNPQVMTMLLQNYRSHPKILEFPNKKFYNSDLVAAGKAEITSWACGWSDLPNKTVPIVFSHVEGMIEKDEEYPIPSPFNLEEVDEAINFIERLLKVGKIGDKVITQDCIAVISPYKKQCRKIERQCSKNGWNDIAISSVYQFQGQERPIVIFSTVRSNTYTLGFLNDPKRLNVALTRAQALLIVIGNMNTLKKNDLWGKFIDFCKDNAVIQVSQKQIKK